jgi:hypothetical protein
MSEQLFRTYALGPGEIHSEPCTIFANSGGFSVEPDVATQALAAFDLITIAYTVDCTGWSFTNLTDKIVPISLRIKP